MKDQTPNSRRLRLRRAINSPYRPVLRYEHDSTPVHRQSFPKLGEPHAYLTSAVSKRGVDSFEEILPTLKQLLQDQALSRRSPPVAQQLSVRPEYPAPSDHRSRSAFMSPHASHPSLPQCPDLNTTPAHPDHAETLVSSPSHAISLASELMSRSPSPLVISHNLTSLAQLPPDSQLTSVPSGDPLVHSAGLHVVVLVKDLNGNHKLAPEDNQFIYNAVAANCVEVTTHRHGYCVSTALIMPWTTSISNS
ncbi:hypothetical protein M405DRAFT_868788 [Rhizopogon salebrosus TDB-379]|nr:hypothetical protein M405DRAFT_868788 [Rhizopogon salebrosus TDB-379]